MGAHSSRDDDDGTAKHRERDRHPPTPERIRGTQMLNTYIAGHTVALLRTLEMKIKIANMAHDPVRVSRLAHEVLSDIVVIALDRAEDFDPDRSPNAWLLGIGAVLLKQRQEKERKRRAREILHADLTQSTEDSDDQDAVDLFDKLTSLVQARASVDMAETVTAQMEFERLRSLVPVKYRSVLHHAILNDLNGKRLAEVLHTSETNARVKLHRALKYLRRALDRE